MPDPASPARSRTAGPLPAEGAAPPGQHRGRSFLAHRGCPPEGERAACGREARAWYSRTAEPTTSDCKYHSSAVPWGHVAEGSVESREHSRHRLAPRPGTSPCDAAGTLPRSCCQKRRRGVMGHAARAEISEGSVCQQVWAAQRGLVLDPRHWHFETAKARMG